MVEAAAQRLAVQRDDPPPRRGGAPEMLGVAAEGGLEVGRVERVEEGAQRVDGGGATKAGTEDRVEPLARHADEQADAAVGGGAGQDGQHREQQQGSEAVTPALAAARVRDLLQGGEQAGERHHGGLRCGGRSALNGPGAPPVPRPPAPPSQTAHLQNRTALHASPAEDCPGYVDLFMTWLAANAPGKVMFETYYNNASHHIDPTATYVPNFASRYFSHWSGM